MSDLLTKILEGKESIVLGGNSSHMGGPSCPPDCRGCEQARDTDARERDRYHDLRKVVDRVQAHDRAEFHEELEWLVKILENMDDVNADPRTFAVVATMIIEFSKVVKKYEPK